MTNYIDQYHRIWRRIMPATPGKEWLMITSDIGYSIGDKFKAGEYYSHAVLANRGLHLREYVMAEDTYQFPPVFNPSDSVWVDADWLYGNAVDYMPDYIGSPERIGGLVVKENENGDTVIVNIKVTVPKSKITKK